jgi:glycosyltransferase involved in cell wall biosynthesis
VQALGLNSEVFLPGFVENPHAYIKRSQVFLLSSEYEGLPRVLIEALAVGCPTVATDCPSGPYEILEAGKWGLLTPMANPEAIAHALAQVLMNPELAQKLSQTGLERAKAFDTQTIAQQYQTFLNQAFSH